MKFRLFLAMSLLPLPSFAAGLRVAGSDLLGAEFETALTAFGKRERLQLSTRFAGSRAGLDDLKSGAADMALAAFAPDEKLPDGTFVVYPLAYRVAVVVVPEQIGVTQITFGQLEGFFGAEGPAGFTWWRDIGATGALSQLAVTTHVLSERDAALSIDLFTRTVLRVPRLKSTVERHVDFATLKTRLSAESGGLAILPYAPPERSGLRTLLVAKSDSDPAYGPTAQNIHTGDYPLRLPIYVIYRKDDAAKLSALTAFLSSEELAMAFATTPALVPVPASARRPIR